MARWAFGTLAVRKGCAPALAATLAGILVAASVEAQSRPQLEHVRWPLLDIVIVPDSTGVWFLVGPNPAAEQWKSGSHLVDLGVDAVTALQWVTVARGPALTGLSATGGAGRVTPPLRGAKGREFVVLARDGGRPTRGYPFVLVVGDSASRIHWKSFASLPQVEALLNALERAAIDSRTMTDQFGGSALADPEPDKPVQVEFQPTPTYPGRLAMSNRIGRVWMSYIVGADGRSVPGSFWPLLSDDSLFTQAAIHALVRSRFKPALREGRPAAQRVFQVILFRTR